MADERLDVPVAFCIFNRPSTTERVFTAIRRARPAVLLLIADGPRPGRDGEAEKCAAARALVERIDWPCDVLRNYSETNLGCRTRISSGIDWVFSNVEESIILEDDCLPDPTFFRFCAELLARYRDDERIMHISGDNFQLGRQRTPYSYYFSRYTHVWGWATWRRAWCHYDVDIKFWPEIRDGAWLQDLLGRRPCVRYWRDIFEHTYEHKIGTWDYQWTLTSWVQGGLSILPNVNLVTNIGFDDGATHTGRKTPVSQLPTSPMIFPLSDPPFVIRDQVADRFTEAQQYRSSPLSRRLARSFGRTIWRHRPTTARTS